MKNWIFGLLLFIVPEIALSQVYTTNGAGLWSNPGIWLDNGNPTVVTPTAANSTSITITSAITVDINISIDQTTVSTGGSLVISPGITLTVADGAGDDLNLGAGTITGTGVLSFAASATYNHSRTGNSILPLATWGAGSLCKISGGSGNVTIAAGNLFQNFELNSALTANRNLLGTLGGATAINGNFTINNTGAFQFRLTSNTAYSLTVGGNFTVSSGTLNLSFGTGIGTINLKGDFSQSLGTTLTESGGGNNCTIVFNKAPAALQNITSSGTISNFVNFTIDNSAGVLLLANSTLPGTLGTLTQTDGNIVLNGQQLTIQGSLSQMVGKSIIVDAAASLVISGAGTLPATTNINGTNALTKLEINRAGAVFNPNSVLTITTLNLFNGSYENSTSTLFMADGGTIERRLNSSTILTNAPDVSLPFSDRFNVVYNNAAALTTDIELNGSATRLNNLTKQGAGQLNLSQSITVNGDLTLSAGTFALGTNNLIVGDDFISNGTITTGVGSTFTFSGSATLTGATVPAFRNLTVNGDFTPSLSYNLSGSYMVGPGATVNAGSGTVTFNGSTTVTNGGVMNLNNVVIAAGSSLTAPSGTMGIAGNFTVTNGTSTFTNNGGTIAFNGLSSSLLGTGTKVFNNVTVPLGNSLGGTVSWSFTGAINNTGSINFTAGTCTAAGVSASITGIGSTSFNALTISGGNSLSCGTITIRGAFSGVGNFSSSGIVGFYGATTMTGGGAKSFTNIEINTGSSFTPNAACTITGNINVLGNGVLNPGNSTTTFDGATIVSGTGSSSITFNNITVNATHSFTANANITINGNVVGDGNITSTAGVTFVGLTMSGTGTKNFGNVTVGTGTLTPNTNYSIAGNLVVNGTLAAGNATTTFDGTTTISGSGPATFNNLSIAGSSTLTARLSSEPLIAVNGSFTNGGTFNGSSGTISLGGDLTNNGTFNGGTGTFSFNTTNSGVTRSISGTNSIRFNNVTIFNKQITVPPTPLDPDVSNDMTPPASVDISGTLSFGEANATIDADGAGSSVLRFLSTGDNPVADGRVAAITFTGSSIIGNITVQRFMSSENRIWRYIASPVGGAGVGPVNSTVADLKSAFPVSGTFTDPSPCPLCPPTPPYNPASKSLFFFDEGVAQTFNFSNYPSSGFASAAPLFNGRGYSAFVRQDGLPPGPVVINFVGTHANTATLGYISLPVSAVANGFSLVGNPYPSAITWNPGGGAAAGYPTATNIVTTAKVRNNGTGGPVFVDVLPGGTIAAGQAFWVTTTAAGNAVLRINENAKTASTPSINFYREGSVEQDELVINLNKTSTEGTDITRVRIQEGSLISYDNFDSEKWNNAIQQGANQFDLSTYTDDNKSVSTNSVPSLVCSQQIKLKVDDLLFSPTGTVETAANYEINFNPSGALKGLTWTLHDKAANGGAGADINVSANPSYLFTVESVIPATVAPDRFYLIITETTPINTSTGFSSPSLFCSGTDALITVMQSQNGITYGVEVNGQYYPNLAQGNGQDINIFLDSDWLNLASNTVRVKANSGCNSQFLSGTPIQIAKEELFTAVGVSAESCVASSVVLSATGALSASNYHWYETESSSTILASGDQFTTPVLSDTTTYYVAAFNSLGCDGPRTAVTAYINNLAEQFLVESDAAVVCRNGSITFTASSMQTGTYKWYETPSSPTVISTNGAFATPALTKTTKYYVSFTNASGCESGRKEVTAQMSSFAPVLWADDGLNGKQICPDGSYTLTANGAPVNSTYAWYEAIDSSSPIVESTSFVTPALTATRNYYLAAKNELGCFTDRYLVETVVDSSEPAENFTFAYDKICKNDVTNIKLSSTDPNTTAFRWYESAISEVMLKEGLQFTTDYLEDDQSYFVAAVNSNGCEGSVRKEVKIAVTKFPEPVIEASQGLLTSNFASGNEWFYDEEPLGGEKSKTLTVTKPGLYNLKVSFDGCFEWASPIFRTDFVTGLENEVQTIELYPNPASDLLSIRVSSVEPVWGEFFDERGIQLLHISLKQDSDIWRADLDVRSISKGLYFLRLSSGSKSITHKVIIK